MLRIRSFLFYFYLFRSLNLGWICALCATLSGNPQQIWFFTIDPLNNFLFPWRSKDRTPVTINHMSSPSSFYPFHSLDLVSCVYLPSSKPLGFCLLVFPIFFTVCVCHVRLGRSASCGMDYLVHPFLFAPISYVIIIIDMY